METERLIVTLTVNDLRRIVQKEIREALAAIKPDPPAPSRKLRIGEVCELTGLKRSTLYGLVFQNRIPHTKGQKLLYFDEQEIREWIDNGQRK